MVYSLLYVLDKVQVSVLIVICACLEEGGPCVGFLYTCCSICSQKPSIVHRIQNSECVDFTRYFHNLNTWTSNRLDAFLYHCSSGHWLPYY